MIDVHSHYFSYPGHFTKNGLPVLLHTGTTFVRQAPLDCTVPRLLDDVATRFPDVKIFPGASVAPV